MGRKPRVFMDISIFKASPDRIVIELFADILPKTAENFRALCVGNRGLGTTTGKPLHYKGCVFHTVTRGFAAKGGDISKNNGTGGESIYGGTFPDERPPKGRTGPGILMMANKGPDTNGSQFYICFRHDSSMDGYYLPFGRVIKGMSTVLKIEQAGDPGRAEITDCGEIPEDDVIEPDLYEWAGEKIMTLPGSNWQRGPYEAKLQKDNDSKKCQSSDGEELLKNSSRGEDTSSRYPHQRSDDTRGDGTPFLWNRFKKSEGATSEDKNNNVTESDKELKTEVPGSQHDLISPISELGGSNAEILELKRAVEVLTNQIREIKMKRSDSKIDWPVVAASVGAVILAGVAYFRNGKIQVVYTQHCNH